MADPQDRVSFVVAPEAGGERLDAYMARHDGRYSRNRYKALIKAGHVALGDRTLEEPNYRVNPGEQLTLTLPEPEDPTPAGEDIPLAIVHEDADLIVVNKPAGLVVHPAAGNWTGTMVNALIHHCGDSLSGIGGVKRPGIVHRLDKETSGLVVVAKSDRAHRDLAAQFADRGRNGDLKRHYVGFAWSCPDPQRGTIDLPLGRDPKSRLRQAVRRDDGGRIAVTRYRVEAVWPKGGRLPLACRLNCQLETGRTHQIRVHLAHIGCPLIGDTLYGSGFRTKVNRLSPRAASAVAKLHGQALHAATLGFRHPATGQVLHFSSDLPKHLKKLENALSLEPESDVGV